ncbi:MAG: septum formation initiator family protein [Flavobacteriales bacterium]|nr:septum formation initiator family protein [Flavobacteriales bacterium]
MKKTLTFLVPVLKNKYIMTFLVFLVWMLFFDKNDLITQNIQRNKLDQMHQDKAYFIEEIVKNQAIMDDLETNPAALERFAREEYLMKKADEDIFVVTSKGDQ